jgi:hypothetical protein
MRLVVFVRKGCYVAIGQTKSAGDPPLSTSLSQVTN